MILLQPRSKFSSRLENFNLHICSSGAHGTEYPLPLPLPVLLAVPLSPRIVCCHPQRSDKSAVLLRVLSGPTRLFSQCPKCNRVPQTFHCRNTVLVLPSRNSANHIQ